ncbi:MAG: hypothetical protein WC919_06790 [Candidatus Paceibacterota bacterium]
MGDEDPGKVLFGYSNVKIVLVVFPNYIVAGLAFFYQFGLQYQSFNFRAGFNAADFFNFIYIKVVPVGGLIEMVFNSLPYIPGLSYI